MSDRIDFAGKVAIVTGAGRGIGSEYALELGRRGARVVVNDVGVGLDGEGPDKGPAETLAARIRDAGGEAIGDTSNIVHKKQAKALVARAVEAWGRVDILINNAGILRDRTFIKKDLADFQAVVDVHLWGTVNVTHAAWPIMFEQRYGRVLITTSISGTLGSFGQADYGAAKAGVFGP
jgi:NAD(P)-dependent dehydrogenase (short-subunit alcohol dehydrogenase family)